MTGLLSLIGLWACSISCATPVPYLPCRCCCRFHAKMPNLLQYEVFFEYQSNNSFRLIFTHCAAAAGAACCCTAVCTLKTTLNCFIVLLLVCTAANRLTAFYCFTGFRLSVAMIFMCCGAIFLSHTPRPHVCVRLRYRGLCRACRSYTEWCL